MRIVKILMVAMLCLVCGSAGAQDREYVRTLLEDFCRYYFEEAYDGKRFLEKTLTVKSMEEDIISGTTLVKGKLSYEGKYIPLMGRMTHRDVDYKAELSRVKGEIKVRFWLWHIPTVFDTDTYWDGPFTKVMLP